MTIENQTLHIPTQNSYSNGTSGSYCTPCCFQTQRNFSAMAPILRRKCQFPGCSWSHNSRDRGTNHLSKFFFSFNCFATTVSLSHTATAWSRSFFIGSGSIKKFRLRLATAPQHWLQPWVFTFFCFLHRHQISKRIFFLQKSVCL